MITTIHEKEKEPMERHSFISNYCKGKTVIDIGCVQHTAATRFRKDGWLHQMIKDKAKEIVGVDMAEKEVKELNADGYDIICADATKRIPTNRKFEVIVAGDIIDHIANFEGFFDNCSRLLEKNGKVIITTCTPFFYGYVDWVRLTNKDLYQPEHTCWMTPEKLEQLADRFDFKLVEFRWVERNWEMGSLVTHGIIGKYDPFTEKWSNDSKLFWLLRGAIRHLFLYTYEFANKNIFNRGMTGHSHYIMIFDKKKGK